MRERERERERERGYHMGRKENEEIDFKPHVIDLVMSCDCHWKKV